MSSATRPRSACAGHTLSACVGLPPRPDRSETASVEQSTTRQATIAGAPLIGGRLEGVRQHAAGGPFTAGSVAAALLTQFAGCGVWLFWAAGPLPPGRGGRHRPGPTSPPQPPPARVLSPSFRYPLGSGLETPPLAPRAARADTATTTALACVAGGGPQRGRRGRDAVVVAACRPECLIPPQPQPIVGHCIVRAAWSVGAASDWRVAPYLPPPDQHHPGVTRRRLCVWWFGAGRSAHARRRRGGELCRAVWVGWCTSVFFFFLSSLSRWRWRQHVQRRSTLALPFVVESLYLFVLQASVSWCVGCPPPDAYQLHDCA